MNKLTDEQLAAFTAFGLLVLHEPDSLLDFHSKKEMQELAKEVDEFLSPFVDDDDDMVSPIINVLKKAVEEAKAKR